MMGIPTPKFEIGQTVYWASTSMATEKMPCPDCLGAKKWKATSPAGTEYEFACPRCSTLWHSDDKMSLNYTVRVPSVQKLTIGSIRIDTNHADDPVEYMCCETGVGSGNVYHESQMFATEDEALAAATAMAQRDARSPSWTGELYDSRLELSDYQLAEIQSQTKIEREAALRRRFEAEDEEDAA